MFEIKLEKRHLLHTTTTVRFMGRTMPPTLSPGQKPCPRVFCSYRGRDETRWGKSLLTLAVHLARDRYVEIPIKRVLPSGTSHLPIKRGLVGGRDGHLPIERVLVGGRDGHLPIERVLVRDRGGHLPIKRVLPSGTSHLPIKRVLVGGRHGHHAHQNTKDDREEQEEDRHHHRHHERPAEKRGHREEEQKLIGKNEAVLFVEL